MGFPLAILLSWGLIPLTLALHGFSLGHSFVLGTHPFDIGSSWVFPWPLFSLGDSSL